MTNEKIKDLIARLGIIYVEHFYNAQEVYNKSKSEEDEKILFIYQKAYLTFNDLSVGLDLNNFMENGKQFREIQVKNANNKKIQKILTDLFKTFKVANALLKCKEGE